MSLPNSPPLHNQQPHFYAQQPQQFIYPQAVPQQVPQQVVYSEAQEVEQPATYSPQPIVEDVTSTAWVPEEDIRYKDGIVSVALNLFIPGLGHFLMGQKIKGITFFLMMALLSTLIGVLSLLVIGFVFIIPATFVWVAYIYDGFVLAERLKKGYPIMKGEISAKWVKWSGACLFVSPSFVTGSETAPQDWHVKVSEVQV